MIRSWKLEMGIKHSKMLMNMTNPQSVNRSTICPWWHWWILFMTASSDWHSLTVCRKRKKWVFLEQSVDNMDSVKSQFWWIIKRMGKGGIDLNEDSLVLWSWGIHARTWRGKVTVYELVSSRLLWVHMKVEINWLVWDHVTFQWIVLMKQSDEIVEGINGWMGENKQTTEKVIKPFRIPGRNENEYCLIRIWLEAPSFKYKTIPVCTWRRNSWHNPWSEWPYPDGIIAWGQLM